MTSQGRILVMDDEDKWRQELSNVLRRNGYTVDTVSTKAAALEHVQKKLYHLLVLDIRMVDPDESNIEGMDLLAELKRMNLLDAVEIIMLSAYGTKEQMREAFRRYSAADFQTKEDFSGRAFVESVNQIFAERTRWNGALEIIWEEIEAPSQIVVGIAVDGKRVKRGTPQQERIFSELDDLLRRLFHNASSILVAPLIPGRSGAGVLRVQPFFAAGKGEAVIVKYGFAPMIDQERHNFKRCVEPFVGGARHTSIIDYRRTPLLGGIIYSLLGAGGGRVESLGVYYQKTSLAEIRKVLDRLFYVTCANWYGNRGSLQPFDLTADYQKLLGFSIESLQKARQERLTSVEGDNRLVFPGLQTDRSFSNPIAAIADRRFVMPAYKCITHGDLNDANVLIDADGYTWLIDFFRTGEGHILRDVAELETVIRLQALDADQATLEERLAMEDMLVQPTQFSALARLLSNFPTENQALTRVFATCVHLRTIAHKILAQNGSEDITEYYIALLYYALNSIRFYSLPTIQREHALLSASILAERLGLGATHG